MKNQALILLVYIICLGCKSKSTNYITIVGCTTETPRGAAILSNDKAQIYYIDGLYDWEENFKFRQVKVQGELKVEKFERSNKAIDGIPAPHIDIKRSIFKATWELLYKKSDTALCYKKLDWHRDNIVFPEDQGAPSIR